MGAWSIESLAQSYFGSAVNVVRTGRPGPSITRESFTSGNLKDKFGGDVCNSMQDYKVYAYFSYGNFAGVGKL